MLPRDAILPPSPRPPAAFWVGVAIAGLTAFVVAATVFTCMSRELRDHGLHGAPAVPVASFTGARAPADPASLERAQRELAAYAYEAWPAWVAANPDRACPQRLLELNHFLPSLHAVDPWGTPYQFLCGAQHGVTGLHVRSAGPDAAFDTADDLASH